MTDLSLRCDKCPNEGTLTRIEITTCDDSGRVMLWQSPDGWQVSPDGSATCPRCRNEEKQEAMAPLLKRISQLEEENAELRRLMERGGTIEPIESRATMPEVEQLRDSFGPPIALASTRLLAPIQSKPEKWFKEWRPNTYAFADETIRNGAVVPEADTFGMTRVRIWGSTWANMHWLVLVSIVLSAIQILIKCYAAFDDDGDELVTFALNAGPVERFKLRRIIKREARRHRRRLSWKQAESLADRLRAEIAHSSADRINGVCREWYDGDLTDTTD